MVQVPLELPDDVAAQLQGGGRDLARRALEALAVEAYCSGEITAAQVQEMLGHSSRWETNAFLKARQAYLRYGQTDLEADLITFERVTQS
jgi:predicted HTH domain antitoxin